MQVIIKGGFTYTAEFLIKEEAYAKLLSAAETFGNDNASAMLGLYLESNVHMMHKNSRISFETHFPSNFVTIIACVTDCEAEVDPRHDRYEDLKAQLDDAFRCRVDILDFISAELDCGDIINKEEE